MYNISITHVSLVVCLVRPWSVAFSKPRSQQNVSHKRHCLAQVFHVCRPGVDPVLHTVSVCVVVLIMCRPFASKSLLTSPMCFPNAIHVFCECRWCSADWLLYVRHVLWVCLGKIDQQMIQSGGLSELALGQGGGGSTGEWITHGKHMDDTWITHGWHMDNTWNNTLVTHR